MQLLCTFSTFMSLWMTGPKDTKPTFVLGRTQALKGHFICTISVWNWFVLARYFHLKVILNQTENLLLSSSPGKVPSLPKKKKNTHRPD